MRRVAVIPVRGGSRRLPNKNILPFNGSNLLVNKIKQLQQTSIDKIVVTSDSQEMLDMASSNSCDVHYRPIEYADEITKGIGDVVAYVVKSLKRQDCIIWAPCVCPLVDSTEFERALYLYDEEVRIRKIFDSVVSVKKIQEYLWDENYPLNYSLGDKHVPSQFLPKWFSLINGYHIALCEEMLKWKYFFGKNPLKIEIPKWKCVDIDDHCDYMIAQALIGYTPPPL